jgi:hypothetical protein
LPTTGPELERGTPAVSWGGHTFVQVGEPDARGATAACTSTTTATTTHVNIMRRFMVAESGERKERMNYRLRLEAEEERGQSSSDPSL